LFYIAGIQRIDSPNAAFADALSALLEHGLDGASEALRILVNKASPIERAQYLQAAPMSAALNASIMPMVSNQKPCSPAWAK
jgi:hypothetical protein